LANHRQLLLEFCKGKGYTYTLFEEVLSGGTSELEARPQLQKLLESIEKWDAILCVELSRISRNGFISEMVLQHCVDYDKPILTPFHVYDLANNENDRLTYRFTSMMSSQEHALIGKRSKLNKIQMAKAGLHISGNVPFGYVRNPFTKKLEIQEEEAEVIRYIFKLHSQGLGSFKIRDILNEEGYKSARSNHWNLPSIKRIIRNPAYKGWTIFHDRKRVKKGGKWTYEILETITMKDTHPAIISEKEWDSANQERENRANKSRITREKPAVKSGITSLKDLVYCGVCGRKMTIRKDNKSNTGYTIKKCEYLLDDGSKCNNAGIRLVFAEEDVLAKLFTHKEELEVYLRELKEDEGEMFQEELRIRLKAVEKRIRETRSQDEKLLELALTGVFSVEQIKEKKQEYANTLKSLEDERDILLQEILKPQIFEMEAKVKGTIRIIDSLPSLNKESANQALKTFVKRIIYKRVIPKDILKLSTRNPVRKLYPFEIEIEYL
jgi:DNA invertase Pin-like site-specific DNA recombinase